MTDYKPGQIAKATVRGVPDVTVMRDTEGFWSTSQRCGGWLTHTLADLTDVRPLVVLDWHPSPTHLAELLNLLREHYWTSLADQIEAQTSPAIEEPKGLGAVVEDDKGQAWVRLIDDDLRKPWTHPEISIRKNWQIVNAVRVLSEGVES